MKTKIALHKQSLKKILVFIAVSLSLLLVTATAVYQIMLRALQQEVETMNQNTSHELMARVEAVIDEVNKTASLLVSSSHIQMFFSHPDPSELVDSYHDHLVNQLKLLETSYVDSVILYSPRYDMLLYTDAFYSNLGTRNLVSLQEAQEYGSLYDVSWLDYLQPGDRTSTLLCTRAKCDRWPYYLTLIKHHRYNSNEGVALVNIDMQKLHEYLIANREKTVSVYVVDAQQRVILWKGQQALFASTDSIPDLVHYRQGESLSLVRINRDTGYAYAQEYSPSSGLTFVTVTQLGDYMVRLSRIQQQFLGILSAAGILVIVLAVFWSIRSRRPLRELRLLLESADPTGNTLTYAEEIQDIADKIISQIQTNSMLEEELDSRLHLLKDTQMLALQAQINPHFLFNTLNVISMMVESECGDGHPVVKMLSELSQLLRYSLSDSKNVRLQDELAYVDRYLSIMKYRYEQFQTVVRVDPRVNNCAIPKLVLQPLIENALQHGLTGSAATRTGMLQLKVNEIDHTYPDGKALRSVCVDVSDNGAGISAEKLAQLRRLLESPGQISREHIGLSNVAHRFYLLFHTHQQLTIDSVPGSGTHVRIIFPAIECPDPAEERRICGNAGRKNG